MSMRIVIIILFLFAYFLISIVFLGRYDSSPADVECGESFQSIQIFNGDSPFSLKHIQDVKDIEVPSISKCDSLVTHPFLFVKGNLPYLFYETKSSIRMKGVIRVADSIDHGVTWNHLGIVVDEERHLSHPFLFEHHRNIYMMLEGTGEELRLYQAIDFPLKWTFVKPIIKEAMHDSSMIFYEDKFWIFRYDHKKGQLKIWYSSSAFGSWEPHKMNGDEPATAQKSRNAGRPFIYDGNIHRVVEDCEETHCLHMFRVTVLTIDEFKEVEVPFDLAIGDRPHLDILQLNSSNWIAIFDGNQILYDGDTFSYLTVAFSFMGSLAFLILLLGIHKLIVTLKWRVFAVSKRLSKDGYYVSSLRPKIVILILTLLAIGLTSVGVSYTLYGSNTDEEPHQDQHTNHDYTSQFTMITMSYEARLLNLKMSVIHYSRCPSIHAILVVWNKGTPPKPSDFDSAVLLYIRVENHNSMNNRYKPDPVIKTRAVLVLDDDILITCSDISRGFQTWKQHQDRIVGYYPRLATEHPLSYVYNPDVSRPNGYNLILTGAAFMDSQVAFKRYWSDEAESGREIVDEVFNCDDLLMNYLYANRSGSSSQSVVQYVQPAWIGSTFELSGVGISISGNHHELRLKCLNLFAGLYGSLDHK